ncbi:hypothetical protein PPL_05081 [Heterostelium album PN500]|uniref:3'-5' exonuclease n=1 Tax=Heterostelium pallidum (strain ATCC 26659 / Pp 5 / PN500) TaxID=670386 RepID=D3B9D7_HETP5|nr:hypothetical protein PPL_05081 [Heterostelium album PN500]EFA81849.1 hypothetical protein PPL_05081 [Heterostelium album PN500]|eukprot:XP_020433966.1 hypothetical protein PPL_05081 [Heterostelium album PN500]
MFRLFSRQFCGAVSDVSGSKAPVIALKQVSAMKNVVKISPINRFDKSKPLLNLDRLVEEEPLLKNATLASKILHPNTQQTFYFEFERPSDAINTIKSLKEKREKQQQQQSYHYSILSNSLDPYYQISQEQIELLPSPSVHLPVHVIDDIDQVESAVRLLLNGKLPSDIKESSKSPVIAVDCEWPGLRKFLVGEKATVSLIQMTNGVVCRIGIPKHLKELLTNDNILKVGHGISKDANKISDDLGVLMENIYDTNYHPIVLRMNSKKLAFAVGKFFGVNILRSKSLSVSNWATSGDLTENQIEIASNEVYFARKLYFEFKDNKNIDVDIDLTISELSSKRKY